MAEDFSKTLNLPNTEFPMRGNLPQKEPQTLQLWEDMALYQKLQKAGETRPKFILHDGPPFANGDIHIGHALNKILKDIVMKYKLMSGYSVPYVPGWDTHGLPIERQAIKKLSLDKGEVSPAQFRSVCRDFALGYVENQKEQFKRLGILGDWENPYLTLKPEYEAKQIEIFADMAKNGYIYKGLKPVYWCTDCETALAEAEIEYQDVVSDSIYVKFRVTDDKGVFASQGAPVYFVIWTTTTWTLPGNVAISVNPRFEYSLVRAGGEVYVIASELLENVAKAVGLSEYEVVGTYKGAQLEYMVCRHPFLDRDSLVIVGEHVTLDAGTGCVHTAPGHGVEDYEVCRKYDVPMIVPLDDKGRLNELAGPFAGMYYKKANKEIAARLQEDGALLAIASVDHSYPHCWRCSHPIVFRATDQWFASVDAFKEKALEEIRKVNWVPAWGEDRITAMVADRKDWCISRQRMWGVPIPVLYRDDTKKPILDEKVILHIAGIFREKGSNSWFELPAEDFLPAGYTAACGCDSFTKETDTMDVWFDSGSSHSAVLGTRDELYFPADMYLEGNDQYRGWFQSSLLTSVAKNGAAPYKTVLTHGFVIDEEKRKMSKSAGNGLPPLEIIREYGADILRLWAASADYKADIRISKEILKQLSEVYRKIRNTARYILGSLSDFDPNAHMAGDFEEIDRWALMRLNKLLDKARAAYETYDFHVVYHAVHQFCVVDLSNFYLDVIKDRTYCEKPDSRLRRSSQSAMYLILDALVRLISPVLAFTAEEIWAFLPHRRGEEFESIWFAQLQKSDHSFFSVEFEEKWERILQLRDAASKELELARQSKRIGSSLGAKLTVSAGGEEYDFVASIADALPTLLIVSQVELARGEGGLRITVSPAEGEKCARCWMVTEDVGRHTPELCGRCAKVLEEGAAR